MAPLPIIDKTDEAAASFYIIPLATNTRWKERHSAIAT
jgi:hypothetical protein